MVFSKFLFGNCRHYVRDNDKDMELLDVLDDELGGREREIWCEVCGMRALTNVLFVGGLNNVDNGETMEQIFYEILKIRGHVQQ